MKPITLNYLDMEKNYLTKWKRVIAKETNPLDLEQSSS